MRGLITIDNNCSSIMVAVPLYYRRISISIVISVLLYNDRLIAISIVVAVPITVT